ncbi:hypothetical protein [Mannheimia massilioguelmaensis]|uniref:hypothetical protein n=1 Tax=Mannheimia massilioguelmaensis TaxID=1604354 RepID=UPI0012E08E60
MPFIILFRHNKSAVISLKILLILLILSYPIGNFITPNSPQKAVHFSIVLR